MWEQFFDALGTIVSWIMWLMLCLIVFVWVKAALTALWLVVLLLA